VIVYTCFRQAQKEKHDLSVDEVKKKAFNIKSVCKQVCTVYTVRAHVASTTVFNDTELLARSYEAIEYVFYFIPLCSSLHQTEIQCAHLHSNYTRTLKAYLFFPIVGMIRSCTDDESNVF